MARKEVLTGLVGTASSFVLILLFLVVYWRALRLAPAEPRFCYSDEDVSNAKENPDLLKQLIVKNDKNTKRKQYCHNASNVLHELIAKMTAEKYNNNANPEYLSFNPADINCIISVKEEHIMQLKHIGSHVKPVPGKPTKIFWNKMMNSAGGLRYLQKEGAIYIQKSGRYYITTQLTTKMENATTQSDEQTVKHLVYRISANEGGEHILLENPISACEMTVEQSEQSSNIGAVFELKEKDRIYVATSHPYNIVSGPGRDHFSIHKM
ncbi:uncharacterized protein LOC123554632 [Mercenaria mercenaria]|uniref:uncharacterized protein LOC123554632 n=1 Tax=Mercenaria mercenaria TaxID=6596 RepID=UPI00234E3DBB|nr:uncharacterized protein LOC123554632 [Mercenaria mercenaria]